MDRLPALCSIMTSGEMSFMFEDIVEDMRI